MKRKQWQRRLLSCFLAVAVLLGGLLCCLPVRAGAIVPLSFVQSALASYVTSSGYKLYNDQGTGSDILGSLGELYDDYVTVNNKTIQGSVATLAWLANSPLIYQDNSGQIVINQVAANIMQDFAEWIQTEYSVPVGSDTPTEVVSASVGSYKVLSGDSYSGISFPYVFSVVDSFDLVYQDSSNQCSFSIPVSTAVFYNSTSFQSSTVIFASINPFTYTIGGSTSSAVLGRYNSQSFYYATWQRVADSFSIPFNTNTVVLSSSDSYRSVSYDMLYGDTEASAAVSGLGVTLAQAVADVIGQAQDDDAVVIGVGAGVGATAQDIADMVAQGVKAQTLDPSVSIVAEAVIDTPVQPYPDVDGLGLPTLGAALVSRFPFCVPWDFVDTLKILNAEPTPPVFDVTLIPASVAARWGVSGDYTLHVDLTDPDYAKLFVALRWGTLVGFCIGLALLTKRLIWTA